MVARFNPSVIVVAECQQRFVVQKSWRTGRQFTLEEEDDYFKSGNGRLPDTIGHLAAKVRFLPTKRLRIPSMCLNNRHKARCNMSKSNKLVNRLGTSRTSFRPFVYHSIDHTLVNRVRLWLENWCKKPELIPTDISDLSFWATQQIPNSNTFKALILAQSSPEVRLMV